MKKFQTFFLTFFFIIGLIFLHNIGYLKSAEDLFLRVLSPVGRVFNISANSGKGIFSSIGGLKGLSVENKTLQNNLNKAEAEIAMLQEAKKENESLRKDLGFQVNSGFETLSASVIMYDITSVRQTIIIDKGEKDDLMVDMIVMSEGFLVGRVVEVSGSTSKVLLITDPMSKIPVLVQNSTATGIAAGQIGYGLNLEKVPQGDVIKKGQTVITSGLGGDYPKGLVVGKIDEIEENDNAIFQSTSVRPEANFRRLERVLLIVK